MERYTEKHYDGNGYYLICSGNCETLNCGDCGILDKIVDRLAAYEDTGLEPGEIEQLKGEVFGLRLDKQELEQYRALGPIDRLRELDQAHKENRVLPEGSGWFVTCSGKKLTVVMDIEAALRREQDEKGGGSE